MMTFFYFYRGRCPNRLQSSDADDLQTIASSPCELRYEPVLIFCKTFLIHLPLKSFFVILYLEYHTRMLYIGT